MIGLRLYPDLEARLDAWIAKQNDQPSRPEAIRRLMEIGLSAGDTKTPRIVATGDAAASQAALRPPNRGCPRVKNADGHTRKAPAKKTRHERS
jgi:hypothetical protein